MYERFYGFSEKPFSISPDPRFLYLNNWYREALTMLQYGIEERRGVVCLTGEVGTGKTMLLNKIIHSIESHVTAVFIPIPKLNYMGLVSHIFQQIGIGKVDSSDDNYTDRLKRFLVAEHRKNRIVALLVDEAQSATIHFLESLRLLSNLETPKEKLLQIVLSGQPELRAKLNLQSLRQFKQRIATSFHLRPLDAREIRTYIGHRLRVAGYQHGPGLFSEGALSAITEYSKGIPRLVNALCENALLIGYAMGKKSINESIVTEAAQDLMLAEHPPSFSKTPQGGDSEPAPPPSDKEEHGRRSGRKKAVLEWAACICLWALLLIGAYKTMPKERAYIIEGLNRMLNSANSALARTRSIPIVEKVLTKLKDPEKQTKEPERTVPPPPDAGPFTGKGRIASPFGRGSGGHSDRRCSDDYTACLTARPSIHPTREPAP